MDTGYEQKGDLSREDKIISFNNVLRVAADKWLKIECKTKQRNKHENDPV